LGVDRVDDDDFAKPERRLELVLEVGMQTRRHAERDADDAFFFSALQQTRYGRLMHVEALGDLRLSQALAVIEARDFGEQTKFVDAPHHPSTFARGRRVRLTASIQPAYRSSRSR